MKLADPTPEHAILRLRDGGMTNPLDIAAELGMSAVDVARVLRALVDTTATAKQYLRGQSLAVAKRLVETDHTPASDVAVLKGVRVLDDAQAVGLVVVIGGSADDVRLSLPRPPL